MGTDQNRQDWRLRCAVLVVVWTVVVRAAVPWLSGEWPLWSPVGAVALLSGALFGARYGRSLLVTFLAIWLSDLLINRLYLGSWVGFYPGAGWQYGSWMVITLLGVMLGKQLTALRIGLASLSTSLIFFAISNFGVWLNGLSYPLTGKGLADCYVAALPFLRANLLGDGFYCALLFGSWLILDRRILCLDE